MSNEINFDPSTFYSLGKIELHTIMVRPYEDYIGKTIKLGDYNEAVKAYYYDIPVEDSKEESCIIRTSYGNDVELKDPAADFSVDDLFFAMHCHDGFVRLWFACNPFDILNDYIKIGFEFAYPYIKINTNESGIGCLAEEHYEAPRVRYETFDIILPTHPNCWEKEYDGEIEKCKCKFTIGDSRMHTDSNISYEYTSKVEDFIHCIVPMEGYILIETYDLPKDREYVRINITLAIDT